MKILAAKNHLSIRTTLLTIVGALNIMIALLVVSGVYDSWENYKQAQSLKMASDVMDSLYNINKNLSLERASSTSIMYSSRDSSKYLHDDLIKNRLETDQAIHTAFEKFRANGAEAPDSLKKIHAMYEALKVSRNAVDDALLLPFAERDLSSSDNFFKASTTLITAIQNFILLYSQSYNDIDAGIARQMMFKYFVWELAEYSGEKFSIIGQLIAENKLPTTTQREQLIALKGRIQHGWEILQKFSLDNDLNERLAPFVEEAHTHYFFTIDLINELFYGDYLLPADAAYPIGTEMWLGMTAQSVDSLLVLQDKILQETQENVALMEKKYQKKIALSFLVFLFSVSLSIYCWRVIIRRVAIPINSMVNALYSATENETFEMPDIQYHHDEIGKLAQVLAAFQKNTNKLKQSNEELERFAFIAAHDLKSPLRAVDTLSQWLEEDVGDKLPEKSKGHIAELRKRIQLMDKLLDDTFEYARINSKLASEPDEVISGEQLIKEIILMLNPPDRFQFKLGEVLAKINLQKFPVQQVLFNLIGNAIKHHDKDRGTVEIDAKEEAQEYVFYIKDDGPGIEPRYHQKIFEMFQTLQSRDKSKGRGLGLAIVKKIIISRGGSIHLESSPGHGSVFSFTWPTAKETTSKTRRLYA